MISTKFIGGTTDYTTYTHHVNAPLFRKTFEIKKGDSAKLTITGLGFYELYINGKDITKGLLSPYISNPDHFVYYDEYDLTPFVTDGKNAMCVILGNGMQNCPGGEIWDFEKASFRGAPRFAFALEITDENGDTSITEADETVKVMPSHITFDDLRCGCHIDNRLLDRNIFLPDYDDGKMCDALPLETPRGEKKLSAALPILPISDPLKAVKISKGVFAKEHPRNDVSKKAAKVYLKEKNGWLYDFGVNTAGIETVRIKGRKGQQIDIQFGEYLDRNGELSVNNINFFPNGYSQRDIFILNGEGEEEFSPLFTYHGARYALVIGLDDEQATEDLITFTPYSTLTWARGDFSCSDDTANALQRIIRNSDRSNFYHFPTDCPHREKNGWTGDAALSCVQMSYNFAPEEAYAQWLENIGATLSKDGQLPGIIPTAGWGYKWGNGPVWDAVLFELPFVTYKLRGDRKIIEDNAPYFMRYADYISRNLNRHGLVDFGLGDWCPVTTVKAPIVLTSSLATIDNMTKAAFMLGEIELEEQKSFCLNLANRIKAAARKRLIDFGTMTAKGSCQTSQAAAIYYNLFDEGEKQAAFKKLLKLIEKADNHIDVGIIGARVIFRVLTDFGYENLAYEMLTRPDFPSYGHFLVQGHTSLPEAFIKDGDNNPPSLNHHFFGDYSAWFINCIAGIEINPYNTDCKEAAIRPHFIDKLTHAEAYYISVCGRISVKWKRTTKGITLETEIPEGIYGEITLPEGYIFEDSELSYREIASGMFAIKEQGAVTAILM